MPVKKKSTYVKQVSEYESPDGESYEISIVKVDDRVYLQWVLVPAKPEVTPDNPQPAESESPQPSPSPVTIDGTMLESLYALYRDMKTFDAANRALPMPSVVDHRPSSIQQSVNETMQNFDDSVAPMHSFARDEFSSPEGLSEMRSGVSISKFGVVPNTPEEWSMTQVGEDLQEDVKQRMSRGRPQAKAKGSSGANYKRVGARDII